MSLAVPAEGEADHLADDRAAERSAVAAGVAVGPGGGGVEVVVAAQHRVDWAEVGVGDRRAGQLRELEPQPKG